MRMCTTTFLYKFHILTEMKCGNGQNIYFQEIKRKNVIASWVCLAAVLRATLSKTQRMKLRMKNNSYTAVMYHSISSVSSVYS